MDPNYAVVLPQELRSELRLAFALESELASESELEWGYGLPLEQT